MGQQLEEGRGSDEELTDGQFSTDPSVKAEDFKRHSGLGNQEEEKILLPKVPHLEPRVPHMAKMDPLTGKTTGMCYDATKFMAPSP